LGEISYSIYLIHMTVIVWIATDHKLLVQFPLWEQGAIGLALILVLAELSHAYVEKPFRHWIRIGWRGGMVAVNPASP
jgi:peptidoglycan/LPS O-acetylase OafA/YrhL